MPGDGLAPRWISMASHRLFMMLCSFQRVLKYPRGADVVEEGRGSRVATGVCMGSGCVKRPCGFPGVEGKEGGRGGCSCGGCTQGGQQGVDKGREKVERQARCIRERRDGASKAPQLLKKSITTAAMHCIRVHSLRLFRHAGVSMSHWAQRNGHKRRQYRRQGVVRLAMWL
jgi:hypothetical protein